MNGLTCCGTNCSLCEFYQNLCSGCTESKGMVFHAERGKGLPNLRMLCQPKETGQLFQV